MNIQKITMYPQEELIRRLREVTLTDGVTKPYANSEIMVTVPLDFSEYEYAQNYILRSDYKKINKLISTLLHEFEISLLNCGTLWEISTEEEVFPYIPPIVEVYNGEWIIADGMHRMKTFQNIFNHPPKVVVIHNPSIPYYALPNGLSLKEIPIVDDRPKVRKAYRDPDNYKALFRDYNSQFPGIQRDRSKDKKEG